ncbi:hypothetical protein E3U55_15790 [Filobacillus milosensis]|uniref:Uncharacterized protein n=1 Tax=Filobacillus milosensis TaxID=94137 RepID=A0A4Y8IFJ5_9BACI|nr:hypothetical protein [Filobacillus milosensis]TFB13581.1 hypothetical protein E3U55_15790 [Filobacillus milosensis]
MLEWTAKTPEDLLLQKYWDEHKGVIFVEVPIGSPYGVGKWPKGSKRRRIDAIRITSSSIPDGIYKLSNNENMLDYLSLTGSIELIEIKQKLSRYIIGQVIAGVDMFEYEYSFENIIPKIICTEGDPALEWVCDKREISVAYH